MNGRPQNSLAAGNMFSGFGGGMTLGSAASSASNQYAGTIPKGETASEVPAEGVDALSRAQAIGARGNPFIWWIVLAIMFVVLMFVGQKIGGADGNFSNIKMTFFNVVIITMCCIVGIPAAKFAVTKVPIPGLTPLVNAI